MTRCNRCGEPGEMVLDPRDGEEHLCARCLPLDLADHARPLTLTYAECLVEDLSQDAYQEVVRYIASCMSNAIGERSAEMIAFEEGRLADALALADTVRQHKGGDLVLSAPWWWHAEVVDTAAAYAYEVIRDVARMQNLRGVRSATRRAALVERLRSEVQAPEPWIAEVTA